MQPGQGAPPTVPRGLVRIRARVDGRVQGVGYRASTQHRARSLGLTGWVRNLADGAVELEAQGVKEAVATLVAWCRRGPPSAVVTEVTTVDAEVVTGEQGFEVRR